MAMITRGGNLHLEIQSPRKNPVGLLRTSFYDKGKTKHTQHGRITGCTLEQLKILQHAFRENVVPVDSPQAFQIIQSKEYGASFSILQVIKKTGLDKAIYSRPEPWVNSILVMIIGRILYAGSKLSLCHQQNNTSLWELCGIQENIDVDKHCYQPMDWLLKRQKLIQKKLAQKHLIGNQLVLYDITSSYLEGEYDQSELVGFGYNRDGKKGHEQIVIGLICNKDGCPVGVEVFPGNTKDSSTVQDKIQEIKEFYGIGKVIFVGDRGMATKHNLEALKEEKDLYTITALTRMEINDLLERNVIQPELFDDLNICEVTDAADPQKRYCLCRNGVRAKKDRETREALIEKTKEKLEQIVNYKKSTTPEILGARVGKVLTQYKTGKYITWAVKADENVQKSRHHQVLWELNETAIERDQQLEGCYIITSNVRAEDMMAVEVVESYKKLMGVEKAFRNLKTVQLEIRPIYHKKDDRIRAHVFLCMLAYYIQWHMQQVLTPLTKEGKGKNRRWTFTNIIETLKQVTRNKVKIEGVEVFKISRPTLDQQRIMDLLKVAI
jgi:transposase